MGIRDRIGYDTQSPLPQETRRFTNSRKMYNNRGRRGGYQRNTQNRQPAYSPGHTRNTTNVARCFTCDETNHLSPDCPNVGKVKIWMSQEEHAEWISLKKERVEREEAERLERLVRRIQGDLQATGKNTSVPKKSISKTKSRKKVEIEESEDEEEDDEERQEIEEEKRLKRLIRQKNIEKLRREVAASKEESKKKPSTTRPSTPKKGREKEKGKESISPAKAKGPKRVRMIYVDEDTDEEIDRELEEMEEFDRDMDESRVEDEEIEKGVAAIRKAFQERKEKAGKGYIKWQDAVRLVVRTVSSPERRVRVIRRIAEEMELDVERDDNEKVIEKVARKLNM